MDLDVTNTLQQLLQGHSVQTRLEGQALVAGDMTISARVFSLPPANLSNLIRLDVNVLSPLISGRTLVESFAGWGSDEEQAIGRAWGNFCRSSLHVLLEVFIGAKKGEDQVEWETWKNGGVPWHVCLGPLLVQTFDDQAPPKVMPLDLLDQLRDSLLRRVSREYHWLRFYYMRKGSARIASECLLDNEPWSAGENLVDQYHWVDGFYSMRIFLVLRPAG